MSTPTLQPTLWERTKNASSAAYTKAKPGLDKVYNVVDKLGKPVNRLSNKVGAEAFWPTTLDKESEKAARILRGFAKDGFYDQVDANEAKLAASKDNESALSPLSPLSPVSPVSQEGVPQGKQRVIVKIPTRVIKQAVGLAIFTTIRTGWVFGGSGGAGVLVARIPETGEWSAPSGIHVQNLSVGFLIGVDIYDTVLVINSYQALAAFTKVRARLGTEVAVAAGPVGAGGALDGDIAQRPSPIWSYVKSRGLYAGIALEGNLVIERTDENKRFYGYEVSAQEILGGKVRHAPVEKYQVLLDTLRAAQGDAVDDNLLPEAGVAPSDLELDTDGKTFGVPDPQDDDPFGVKALEAEGMVIREAGTHQRPNAAVFEFRPAPSSPIYGHFRDRKSSVDSSIKGRNWRSSTHSLGNVSDRGTQTDDDEVNSSHHSPSRKESQIVHQENQAVLQEKQTVNQERQIVNQHNHTASQDNQDVSQENQTLNEKNQTINQENQPLHQENKTANLENQSLNEEKDTAKQENGALAQEKTSVNQESPNENSGVRQEHQSIPQSDADADADTGADADAEDHTPESGESFSDIDSDAEIHTATPIVSKARVVTVPKRIPPAVPPRNPHRVSSQLHQRVLSQSSDQVSLNGTSDSKDTEKASNPTDEGSEAIPASVTMDNEDKIQSTPGAW